MAKTLKNAIAAAVIIGRNEGERLKRCIQSTRPHFDVVIYVDSGSTDQSVEYAKSNGCLIVDLDTSLMFSAARARNEGYKKVQASEPNLEYVQFIDGDCELQSTWPQAAKTFLDNNPEAAVVCGRRRERFPEKSVYNQLCDWEWAIPPGEIDYCGGDVLMRAKAFAEVGGYRDGLIAGEEPELCVRLRGVGWKIFCIDQEMTLHDASILKFGQWWQRAKRSGYAYAAGACLHGRTEERMWLRQSFRTWAWAFFLPLTVTILCSTIGLWGLTLLLAYPLQGLRQFANDSGQLQDRAIRSLFNSLSRFPELAGQLSFLVGLVNGKHQLIEYK